MPSYRELLADVKREIREAPPADVKRRLDAKEPVVLLDVREPEEWQGGHLPGAVHIPRGTLEMKVGNAVPDPRAPVVVYCAGGARSAFAARSLKALGYENVVSMAGGFGAWRDASLPVEVPPPPAGGAANGNGRYSRHLMLPEIGEKGQRKISQAKVLLIGAGGLGSPATLYLAAAGIGTLGVMDGDVVDESNLQRQVLHRTQDVGRPKVDSARDAIRSLNPDVKVRAYPERITPENAEAIVREYDVVVDGADNFATRYLVNDVCVLLGKPNCHGSIFRFEGQATTFVPGKGPCYRCLYPSPPPPELAPS
ncbi:MAG: ThiF family adenylyltransferase [Planctomycetales bacterium]|nr:ThiF family adenylyltransferase [Planctomycetales bacterium]